MMIKEKIILQSAWIETPLGTMMALADEKALFVLEFADRIEEHPEITPGNSDPLRSIEAELNSYFNGTLKEFKTPLHISGTPFQKLVWAELLKIPYGETRSYLEQATAIGKKSAFRAVANANGANKIAIVIPCHRIINNNGALGGYGGGLARKQWLLDHEKKLK